ncbi:MAG: branched-chain amino acid ABC transporter permease, partial [Candidatus Bathyarchaeia archaeon]
MAETYNFLYGFCGLLDLGLQMFVGFGGYVMAILTSNLGFSAWVALPISGATSAILALALSFLIYRMKGLFFAMGTFMAAWTFYYWFTNWSYVGGGWGMTVPTPLSYFDIYYASLTLAATSTIIIYLVLKSRLGIKFRAIADDEEAAESYGVNIFQIKLIAWVLSASVAGLAGSLYFAYSGFIAPISAFTPYWSFTAMTSTIIGGIRTLLGPIIGAFIIVFLRQQFLVIFPGLSPLVFGIIMATTVLLAPQGILGIAPKIYRSLKIRLKSIKKIKILS